VKSNNIPASCGHTRLAPAPAGVLPAPVLGSAGVHAAPQRLARGLAEP